MNKQMVLKTDVRFYYAWLLASCIYFTPLRTMLIAIGNYFVANSGFLLSKISIIMFGFFLVLPLFLKKEKMTKDMLILFGILLISWCASLFCNPDYTKEWIRAGSSIFIKAFPYYCIARKIQDWNYTKNVFYKSSFILTISISVAALFYSLSGTLYTDGTIYNQFLSYNAAPAAIISLIAFEDKRKLKYLANFAISGYFVFIFGARAPLLCIALAAFVLLFINVVNGSKKKYCRKRVPVFLILGMFFSALLIASVIIDRKTGYSSNELYKPGSRILYSLATGGFFLSNSRLKLYKNSLNLILHAPLMGTGMINDRRQLADLMGISNGNFLGTYAHNIFLELITQFGIILGGLICLLIIYLIYHALIFCRNIDKQKIYIYVISFGVGQLLVSGPTLAVKEFWILLGMGAALFFTKKYKLTND